MNEVRVQLKDEQRVFRPDETVRGVVTWNFDRPPSCVEARLCWHCTGASGTETRTIETRDFDKPAATGKREFSFRLPDAPCSFQAAYATLNWAVEIVALPSRACAHVCFDLSPAGEPLSLYRALKFGEGDDEDEPEGE